MNKRKLKGKEQELIRFFEKGFESTGIPNKVYFGANNSSISCIIGGIYLCADAHTGEDCGIWMIEDKIHNNLSSSITQKEIKSTKNNSQRLFWIHFKDMNHLESINNNDMLWNSYRRASYIIKDTPFAKFIRKDYIKDKALLTEFWDYENINNISELKVIDEEFQKQLNISKNLSNVERLSRLEKADKFPTRIVAKTVVFKRNSDVVAEVLARANGKCELCNNLAPFIRSSDNTPYLEVHHKIPLSECGEDTCDNAIALCPNCHRKQHYEKIE